VLVAQKTTKNPRRTTTRQFFVNSYTTFSRLFNMASEMDVDSVVPGDSSEYASMKGHCDCGADVFISRR
jgi:hypothetical protein